jgi:hypothetical protein
MPNVRELLESAVPYDARGAAPAAEVRRLGRRRQRRSQAVGVVIGVTAIALSTVGVVRFVLPVADQVAPTTTVAPSPRASFTPQPTPTPTGPELSTIVGTRWLVDLVDAQVATEQAYPEDTGSAPRALMTFEPDHVLVLDYIEKGRTTTVRGTWAATSESPALDGHAAGELRLTLATPSRAPATLVLLLNRASLVTSFAMLVPDNPPPSLAPLTMSAYSSVGGVFIADLVKPGLVLPSPYPQRP